MCGRFHLTFLPDPDELFEYLFNIPFPECEHPPILSNDILPFNDITTIYSNFDKTLYHDANGTGDGYTVIATTQLSSDPIAAGALTLV